ncbi:MAG: signal peptidase I [Roseiflexaceae bacterium]
MDETPLRRRLGLDQPSQEVVNGQGDDTGWQPAPEQQGDERALPSVRGVVKELLETAIFILLVFLIVRGVIQNFKIEGQSMEPSMHTGQYILVNKIVYFHFDMNAPLRLLPGNGDLSARVVYPFHMPRRGEVVVFEYPRDLSKDYIKRVIGMPGDTVMIKDGQVFVNNVLLDEPYLQGVQTTCRGDDPCNQGQSVPVPLGSVFVMGDNRNNSSDSREWGELPLDGIIGKAWVSYWPRDYWGVIPTPTYGAQP